MSSWDLPGGGGWVCGGKVRSQVGGEARRGGGRGLPGRAISSPPGRRGASGGTRGRRRARRARGRGRGRGPPATPWRRAGGGASQSAPRAQRSGAAGQGSLRWEEAARRQGERFESTACETKGAPLCGRGALFPHPGRPFCGPCRWGGGTARRQGDALYARTPRARKGNSLLGSRVRAGRRHLRRWLRTLPARWHVPRLCSNLLWAAPGNTCRQRQRPEARGQARLSTAASWSTEPHAARRGAWTTNEAGRQDAPYTSFRAASNREASGTQACLRILMRR